MPPTSARKYDSTQIWRSFAQVSLSLLIVGFSMYMLYTKTETQELYVSLISTILGVWLPSPNGKN